MDPLTATEIKDHARALGFDKVGIVPAGALADEAVRLEEWLRRSYHGDMSYMAREPEKRADVRKLLPSAKSVVAVALNYYRPEQHSQDAGVGKISRYAWGDDYHDVLREKLSALLKWIQGRMPGVEGKICVDSSPAMDKVWAQRAGLGWIGKHTNLISREAGSYFFIGEILTDLPLPVDEPASAHCGTCIACMPACPTAAITAPGQLDARRCISYLTIELPGSIPVELRRMVGNRIYGCDDCQLVCPWNKFARAAAHPDFKVRHGLDAARLADLFAWTEQEFLARTEGSAIRRIGYERWLRNIAVALGNAPSTRETIAALESRLEDSSALVREHVDWALQEQAARRAATI